MATMQGSYTADGKVKYLEVPFDANWLKIVNLTVTAAGGAGSISEAYWQQNMDYGIGYTKLAADDSLASSELAAATGITKFNSGTGRLSAINATVTAITVADPPLVQLTSTTGLNDGDTIRMVSATGATQLNGMDFTIGNLVANTQFELTHMAQIVAGTTASFYKVNFQELWYPNTRYISAITAGTTTVIEMTVTHGYSVGEYVRIKVPSGFGMTELNSKQVKITAVDTTANTITVDIDSTGFTAFTFPVTGTTITSRAQVIPISGTISNTQVRGFEIQPGAAAAGGVANDVIYWVAGDSFGI